MENLVSTEKLSENTSSEGGTDIFKEVKDINNYLVDDVKLYGVKIVREDGSQFIKLVLKRNEFVLKSIETTDIKLSDDLMKLYTFGFKGGRRVLMNIENSVHASLNGMTPVLSTKTLGFVEQYGEIVGFQGVKWIPAPRRDDKEIDKAVSEIELPQIVGDKDIEKLNRLLKGKEELQLVVLWNLMAPLVAFLSKDTAVCNPILLLHGKSSSGKTTAATLAASMSCNVDYKRLVSGLTATDNALLLKLAGINGLGVVLDDTSNSGIKRITDTLYSLSDGFGKTRATSRGGMITSKGFRTSIILTSESNLLDYADVEKEGLYGRVFPLAVSKDNLFTSASEASAAMTFCRESAGHMVSEIVDLIFKSDRTELKNKVDMKEQKFLSEYECNNSIVARWGKIISIMELVAEMSSLDFDMESIKDMMVENIEKSLKWVRGVQAESQIDNFYEACKESGEICDGFIRVKSTVFKDCFRDCIMSGLNQKTVKLKMIQKELLESTKSEVAVDDKTKKPYRYYKFKDRPNNGETNTGEKKGEDSNNEGSII